MFGDPRNLYSMNTQTVYSIMKYTIDSMCYDTNRVEALLHLDPINVLLLENTPLIYKILKEYWSI